MMSENCMETTRLNGHVEERRNLQTGEPWLERTKVVITPAADKAITQYNVIAALFRHTSGDWGDVDEFDWKENDRAVEEGGRVLSSYHTEDGTVFWLITEADRSCTTVLLP